MGIGLNIYSSNIYSNSIKNLRESTLLAEDKTLIEGFANNLLARGRSKVRAAKYVSHLKQIAKRLTPLKSATRKEVEVFMSWLGQQEYSEETKTDYRTTVKLFYKWLKAEELGISVEEIDRQGKVPESVNWFMVRQGKSSSILPEQLLTEGEILHLLESAKTVRDKAFIAAIAESGCRIGEIGSRQIKHLSFDSKGAILMVDGKTGPRRVRLVTSTIFLTNWINQHRMRNNPEAPLWISYTKDTHIKHSEFTKILGQAAKKVGLTKPINPHQFRHGRATKLAGKLPEALIKDCLGWTQDSRMVGRYIHLSGKNVDNAILEMNGIKTSETQEPSKLTIKKCLCGEPNEPTAMYCAKCTKPLSMEAAIQKDLEDSQMQKDALMKYEIKFKEMEAKQQLMVKIFEKFESLNKQI